MKDSEQPVDTPTLRKITIACEKLIEAHQLVGNDQVSANEAEDSLISLLPFASIFGESQDAEKKAITKKNLQIALHDFEKIARKFPQIRGRLTNTVSILINTASMELLDIHRKAIAL